MASSGCTYYAPGRGEKDDEKKDWPNIIDETIDFLFCRIAWAFNLISSALFNFAVLGFSCIGSGKEYSRNLC